MKKSNAGLTLVEMLISGSIAAVLFGGVYTFVAFSGQVTRDTKAVQQLQHESAYVSDVFIRKVRNAKSVSLKGVTEKPGTDITTNSISAWKLDQNGEPVELGAFEIEDGQLFLEENGEREPVFAYESQVGPSSHFKVYANGEEVDLILSLNMQNGDTTYQFTDMVVKARCKNWVLGLDEPPATEPVENVEADITESEPYTWYWDTHGGGGGGSAPGGY